MNPNHQIDVTFPCGIHTTCDVFNPYNPLLAQAIAPARPDRDAPPVRTAVFVDRGVLDHWPGLEKKIIDYADAHAEHLALVRPIHAVPAGEAAKNDPAALDDIYRAIHDNGLCRHSCVVAVGGGAVLDTVGFAAATSHRGVRLTRIPTTTLAQADSGVGVKNGVNRFGKKNFLGSFTPPWAVICDDRFLTTLDQRDWLAGFSEVIKVALVKSPPLFNAVLAHTDDIRRRNLELTAPLIRRSAELHLEHITRGGDPFELLSARPLDFGHWAAHKLEELSGFELRHGEAVAAGIAIDAHYAAMIGLLPRADARLITHTLADLGFDLTAAKMIDGAVTVQDALEQFRQHLGGTLTIMLLAGIGHPINVHEIDAHAVVEAIAQTADTTTPAPQIVVTAGTNQTPTPA